MVVLLAPAAALPQTKSGKSGVYEQLNLFGEAFERIRHDAVEPVGDASWCGPRSPACWPASTRIRFTDRSGIQGAAEPPPDESGRQRVSS